MSIKKVFLHGTLGDAYIQALKLLRMKEEITAYHYSSYYPTTWKNIIDEIFSNIVPNVKINYIDHELHDIFEVTTDCHEGEMEFFPDLKNLAKRSQYHFNPPYIVLQPHSGKPEGRNSKHISQTLIQELIKELSNTKIIILGTSEQYLKIEADNVSNMIGKTNFNDIVSIISNASSFVGPEGLLSFIALSQKIDSDVFFISYEAVRRRIIRTPWFKFCNLIYMR